MAPARECGRTIAHKREPQKAEVFRWSLPPHPAADSFIHGLRTVMYLRISGLASYGFSRAYEQARGRHRRHRGPGMLTAPPDVRLAMDPEVAKGFHHA